MWSLRLHARPVRWCLLLVLVLLPVACGHAGERNEPGPGDDIRPPSTLKDAEIFKGEDDRSVVPPRLVNEGEVRRVLERAYPPEMNGLEAEARAVFWLLVNESGRVEELEIATSSGSVALDSAAAHVIRVMRFEPGTVDDEPTRVWITQTVSFRPQ